MEFYPTNEYREVTLQVGLNSVQLGNTDKLFSDGLEEDEYIYFDDSKEYVTEVIKNYQKTNNVEFESPVELMDAICDEYGWQWEDFYYDIEIALD